MNDSYRLALSPRCISLGMTVEDDPKRSAYLDKLLREKKRPQSNWQSVLSTPMRHQKWIKDLDEKL